MLDTSDLIALVTIGLFAGVVGGLLGVGGSIVMIPAMTEVLGPNQHVYQGAAMIVNFFVVVPAVYQHALAGAIDPAVILRIIPLTVPAVVAGVALSELPLFAAHGEAYLRGLFGLFLLSVVVADIYRVFRRGRTKRDGRPETTATVPAQEAQTPSWRLAAAVALPTGLVAGLLGVGGGILAVPLQRRFLRVPMRTAIAHSATIIVATSFIGAVTKNYALMASTERAVHSLALAAVLIPTAIVGSLIGSRSTHRLPLTFVKTAFFVLLFVAAVRLTYTAARSL